MIRRCLSVFPFVLTVVWLAVPVVAQTSPPGPPERIVVTSRSVPLPSLRDAAAAAVATAPPRRDVPVEVPNFRGETRTVEGGFTGPDPLLQDYFGPLVPSVLASFDGSDNDDNAAVIGGRVAPPDTDGDVGPGAYVQMINLITTVFDKSGSALSGPFPSNVFWSGLGGVCASTNRGDPVVLYDEASDRWLVSQFAFATSGGNPAAPFSQCVAVSQSGDPLGAYHRYAFDLTSFGFNDYPKHGITSDAITLMANLFTPPFFFFGGSFIGAMDKAAMYAGQSATLVGFNLGGGEFGFVAGDLDDAAGTAGFVPPLFATAMSRTNLFDIWRIDVDWANPGGATASRIAAVPISPYDNDLCTASREACIPQPSPGTALEAISDRLMHRLQIRDFGTHRSMVTAHTVDVGGGRAGIRWYELRESGGVWSLYQQGTWGPADGLHRWMPSIAMNAAGDIGLGYLVASSSTFLSTAVTGQSAAASGSGTMDGGESFCRAGTGAQTQTARSGDYSATTVDPTTDTFWHTNEYVLTTGSFEWNTWICEFSVSGAVCGDAACDPGEDSCSCAQDCGQPPADETGLCSDGEDNDCDTFADCADNDCSTDPACATPACNNNGVCEVGEDCVNCPNDCPEVPAAGAAACGNGLCEAGNGEDCVTCPSDCNGIQTGKPDNRFCCGFGGQSAVGCSDPRCTTGGYLCTEEPVGVGTACCGDGSCDASGAECGICDLDCGVDPVCQPSGVVLHVGDLDGSSTAAPRNRWEATVSVTVHDAGEVPVAAATVSGSWSGGTSGGGSCVTNSSGSCSVSKGNIKGNDASVTFTVSDVVRTGDTYDGGANHDPDGDSDGTAITIVQP